MTDTEYSLLDSGDGEKLERFAEIEVVRPSPQALWRRTLPAARWSGARARYLRSNKGGGRWDPPHALPEQWDCRIGGQQMLLRPTGFGHVGVFPEQVRFWHWLQARVTADHEVLNLFGYTGGSTIAAARGGARVTHCDASRGVVQWASENARRNDLNEAPVRWIVDDALKFLRREARRERRYHGIVLDPPSFGRGPKGEVWKLEEGIGELLAATIDVLHADTGAFVLLSAHTPGLGGRALENLLRQSLASRAASGPCAHGEMVIASTAPAPALPSGTWAAWAHDGNLPPPDAPNPEAPA